jgi:hypothetical protein
VRRFVGRGGEDVVGGDHAADREQDEASHQQAGMLRQKGLDAGVPDAGDGGRGRSGCVNGAGFPGLRGCLFSGQDWAPAMKGCSGLSLIV